MTPSLPCPTPLYPRPAGAATSLRVVLVTPPRVPGWLLGFLQLAATTDWIDVFVVTAPDAVTPGVTALSPDLRAFLAFDRVIHGQREACLAMQQIPASDEQGGGVTGAAMPLAARVAALLPDLVILLGPRAWAAGLAEYARRGCWHLDGTLVDPLHAGLALLGPMLRREGATQTQLILETPGFAPAAMAESWGRTRSSSFRMQREDAFRKLPALLLLSLHRIAATHDQPTDRSVATLRLGSLARVLGKAPGLRGMLAILAAAARSLAGRFRQSRGWLLVIREDVATLDPSAATIGQHALIKAPIGWWADPCAVTAGTRKLVFVEDMANPKTHKATIACIELVDGGVKPLGVVLDEPGHLSFPQVFQWEGQWYLTVESGYARRVSLYRATDFPLKWERLRDLITDRVCVDPVLYEQDGHWYLFANAAEYGSSTCDDLYLFHAERLEGPFRPHPASPVLGDARRARMAGRLFHHRGRLIRPAQDCTPSYGKALVFHEVLELSPTAYRERALSRLDADWAPTLDACHTYSIDAGLEVLDVLGRAPPDATYIPLPIDAAPDSSDRSDAPEQPETGIGAAVRSSAGAGPARNSGQ